MDLISKKELLEQTGISYGQLYRWKRERLLPEEWFIKKPSFTGQETFLPREQALGRVKTILELKDKFSLEELANILSVGTSITISLGELNKLYGICADSLAGLPVVWVDDRCAVTEIALTVGVYCAAKRLGITAEQTEALIKRCQNAFGGSGSAAVFTLFKSDGEYHVVFHNESAHIAFDSGIDALETVSLSETVSEIAGRLKDMSINE